MLGSLGIDHRQVPLVQELIQQALQRTSRSRSGPKILNYQHFFSALQSAHEVRTWRSARPQPPWASASPPCSNAPPSPFTHTRAHTRNAQASLSHEGASPPRRQHANREGSPATRTSPKQSQRGGPQREHVAFEHVAADARVALSPSATQRLRRTFR